LRPSPLLHPLARPGVFVSWLVTGVLQVVADRAAGQRTLRRRCGTPLPQAAGPGSRTGPDLQSLVAGPGFEPGKAFADDFTDPGRYCL